MQVAAGVARALLWPQAPPIPQASAPGRFRSSSSNAHRKKTHHMPLDSILKVTSDQGSVTSPSKVLSYFSSSSQPFSHLVSSNFTAARNNKHLVAQPDSTQSSNTFITALPFRPVLVLVSLHLLASPATRSPSSFQSYIFLPHLSFSTLYSTALVPPGSSRPPRAT